MKCRAVLLAMAMTLASATAAMAADAFASLPSYRASFKMSLAGDSQDPTVQSADGQMFFEWKRVCGGYSYLQQSFTDYVNSQGDVQRQELTSQSFESTDGTKYRFHFIDRMDGQTTEEFQGRGTLSPNGKGGFVEYTKPEESRVRLPAGTIFPTVYTVDILNAAKAGKRTVRRNIFDGMGEDPRYDAVAFIGKEGKPTPQSARNAMVDPKGLLVGHHWWNVSLAFYTAKTSEGLPDYEMSARFYDNGITTNLLFNYGNIMMKGELERIEPALDETCKSASKR